MLDDKLLEKFDYWKQYVLEHNTEDLPKESKFRNIKFAFQEELEKDTIINNIRKQVFVEVCERGILPFIEQKN